MIVIKKIFFLNHCNNLNVQALGDWSVNTAHS